MQHYREAETYTIIGICMEVHRNLGPGLLEIIYKDALEIEFKENNILFEREKEYSIEYKGKILPHKFCADFVLNEDIILEVKAVKEFSNEHIAQILNYIKLSNSEVGLLVNFQTKSLQYKRYV
ncbi:MULTISPECIES: GxxExxY protein [Flavobacterium]|uniref:GxxExxY protein n=2 Tax=Flavobacterium TaxID=237 RepID=A0A941AV49_9FLAO|nr:MULTISPECIES: GxxExxY protein [Flavobacterium]MBP4136719.1 GxxExxY protein [Flavobacterium geliluteum]MDX6183192.1 GxxExxY protein [Flavobacterium sp. Fl-33]MDX6187590.1 GxxExxY protein [Flavobacterium sp. Fl-77]UFH40394.1 GxxExxY protein [Flavobacterium sp. F-70]